jgi:hypothetical protein
VRSSKRQTENVEGTRTSSSGFIAAFCRDLYMAMFEPTALFLFEAPFMTNTQSAAIANAADTGRMTRATKPSEPAVADRLTVRRSRV